MMRHAARHADNAVDTGRTLARACSFAAGTPIHTPMGLAAIEDLVYSDQLLARSETTGNLTYKRILDAYNHYHTDGLTITVGNSEGQRETIVATGEHPFYVMGQGFTRADELTVGQQIATHTQQPVEVLEVDLSPLELVAYNYTVEDYETYFVGEFGLWVHNACAGGIVFTRSQLQHGFKHAKDFGVTGNANNRTLAEFSTAIERHISDVGTQAIQGTYRGQNVTHFVDPSTGLNVIRDASGNFLSGWKLSPKQLEYVMDSGRLGGG